MQRSIRRPSVPRLDEYRTSRESRRRWQTARILLRNRGSLAGLVIVVGMIAVAAAAPLLTSYPPSEVHIQDKTLPPSGTYWFGTDQFGRDIFSRLLYGGRISLALSVVGVGVATLIGTTIGAVAGFGSRWIDEVLMRAMDILMAFPYIVLAIALISIFEPSLRNIVLVVAFTRVPQFARLARGVVLSLRSAEYVVAARTVGLSERRILFRHVLPNIATPITVLASLSMATAILTESALSFLGLGIQPPTPSWGTMIGDGQRFVADAFWISTVPGVAISLAILGFNLLGDGLQDALDPRLRSRL